MRLLACAGLALLAATGHRPILPLHLAVRCALLLPVFVAALESLRGAAVARWRVRSGQLALAALLIGIGWGCVALVARRQVLDPMTLERHRAGDVWVYAPLPEISWVEQQAAEGERVFLLPQKGGFHFLTRTRSAVSLPYLIEGQNPPDHVARVIADLDAVRPRLGVYRDAGGLPDLYRALSERYVVVARLDNGHTLFRLRSGTR